jgi:hypothetical protein
MCLADRSVGPFEAALALVYSRPESCEEIVSRRWVFFLTGFRVRLSSLTGFFARFDVNGS